MSVYPSLFDRFIVMGPDGSTVRGADLPMRPKFSWDLKSAPWTDGKGSQEQYAEAVSLWKLYHDTLPDNTSGKIPKKLQGIVLKSQLYGRARDLARSVPQEMLVSDDGSQAIVDAVHKRDGLSVVNDIYSLFNGLVSTRRHDNESFENYESRFAAKLSKFNSFADSTRLCDALSAFLLLSNASVDNAQKVSILAACNSSTKVKQEASASTDQTVLPSGATPKTNDDFIKGVFYEDIAGLLRQCKSKQPARSVGISGNSVSTRPKLTPEQLAKKKLNSRCRKCQKWGHWDSDHLENGKLKPNTPSRETKEDNAGKGAVTFNMVNVSKCPSGSSGTNFSLETGPLLDDGAPYSGIGEQEFHILRSKLQTNFNGTFDELPIEIAHRPYWQYGNGNHASKSKRIIGSILIDVTSDQGNIVRIRHLVIEGSSQWVVGRNITKHCNIQRIAGNLLELPTKDESGIQMTISLVDHDLHCYLPLSAFGIASHSAQAYCAVVSFAAKASDRPWSEIKAIVDKVHKHVCGHASLRDMQILLERNDMWSTEVKAYLHQTVEVCHQCKVTDEPKDMRKVSLRDLSSSFNDRVCLDHVFLDDYVVLHFMDSSTRLSQGAIVTTKTVREAIDHFEMIWVSQYGYPESLLADQAFITDEFKRYADSVGMNLLPVPSRRHNKNVLESKHRVLRDIFNRIKECNSTSDSTDQMVVQQVMRIANNLYGNDVVSSYELAKGYTLPLVEDRVMLQVPPDLIEAHNVLKAKRKLNLILKSKAVKLPPISVGDLVDVYVKLSHQKRGKWIGPKKVLSCNVDAHSITYPGKRGKISTAALEDVRVAIENGSLAKQLQVANDELSALVDENVDEAMDDVSNEVFPTTQTHSTNDNEFVMVSDDDINNSDVECSDGTPDNDVNDKNAEGTVDTTTDDVNRNEIQSAQLMENVPLDVGNRVKVFWPDDNEFYEGTVARYNSRTGTHTIHYDDGDSEILNMKNEQYQVVLKDSQNDEHQHGSTTSANNVEITPACELSSESETVVKQYLDYFGFKEFTLSQAQGLPRFVLHNSYVAQEKSYLDHAKKIHVSKLPKSANIISSHTLYKVKSNDNGQLYIKARIVPHGNRDRMKSVLKTDSNSCSPIGLRLVCSIATLFSWPISKVDFNSAFLQSGASTRDVYVRPPKESDSRVKFYWLLLTASYGLVNANSKWQTASDDCLYEYGLQQLPEVPQLFFSRSGGELSIVAAKVVDDILIAAPISRAKNLISHICSQFKLGTIVYGPACFEFYGLKIDQDTDMFVTVSSDKKLDDLTEICIDRTRRKQSHQRINEIEQSHYNSINGKLCWSGVISSPFCAFAASYLQQKSPTATVQDLVLQNTLIRKVKDLGTMTKYVRPSQKGTFDLNVVCFADASKVEDKGQLGMVTGLMVGDFTTGAVFHALTWFSKRAKRPVKSTASAEVLATGAAADEGILLKHACFKIFGVNVGLHVILDTMDLYDTISTKRLPTDKAIKGDVASLRYDFEIRAIDKMIWIPGKFNLSDPLTKRDSPLEKSLQLTLHTGLISVDLSKCLVNNSKKPIG